MEPDPQSPRADPQLAGDFRWFLAVDVSQCERDAQARGEPRAAGFQDFA